MIDYTLIFMHIGKTGGTTIKEYIDKYIPDEYNKCDRSLLKSFDNIPSHVKYIDAHLVYGLHKRCDGKCKYFSVIREPIDREISAYYYALEVPQLVKNDLHPFGIYSFKDYILKRQANPQIRSFSNLLRKSVGISKNYVLPMFAVENCNETPKNIEITDMLYDDVIQNINKDFIHMGLTERLGDTIRFINKCFNLPINKQPKSKKRITLNRPTIDELDNDIKELLIETHKYDFKLYNYVKDNYNTLNNI